MYAISEKNICTMSKAAALETQYVQEALSNIEETELCEINEDIFVLEARGVWSRRIVDILQRARLIAEADLMLARFEAA